MDKQSMSLFRELTEQEKVEFKTAARSEYQPFTVINPNWHPVYRQECVQINHKTHKSIEENSN